MDMYLKYRYAIIPPLKDPEWWPARATLAAIVYVACAYIVAQLAPVKVFAEIFAEI